MRSPKLTRVKVCCIGSVEQTQMAVRYGASAVGFVSTMPGGPGIISDEVIAAVAAEVPPLVDSFLTTCAQNAATVIDQQRRSKTSALSAL